jgi:hypothetical protein
MYRGPVGRVTLPVRGRPNGRTDSEEGVMFGLGTNEVLLIALLGVLLVVGVLVLWRAGILGPPKFSPKDDEPRK